MTEPAVSYPRPDPKRWNGFILTIVLVVVYIIVESRLMSFDYTDRDRVFYPLLFLRNPWLHFPITVLSRLFLGYLLWRASGRNLGAIILSLALGVYLMVMFCGVHFYSMTFEPMESIRHNDHIYRLTYGWEWCSDFDCTTYWYTILECDSHGLFCYRVDSLWGGDPRAFPDNIRFAVDETDTLYLQYGEERLPVPSRD